MTHRKLYWILTIIIIYSICTFIYGITQSNSTLSYIGIVVFIISFIIRIIVKVDNGLKGKQDK